MLNSVGKKKITQLSECLHVQINSLKMFKKNVYETSE